MNDPKRYEMANGGYEMLESCYGEYVEYDDYMTLLQQHDKLLAENAKLQTQLNAAWSKAAFVGEGSFDGCGD